VIGDRDRQEFEVFVAASSDRLLRIAYLLTGDLGHAEDVVQSALLRTARRWRSARRSPEAYARTTVVNLVKDRWRGLGRRPTESPLDHDIEATRDADPYNSRLDRDLLMRAARALPLSQRAVLVLRFFEDLSVEETARTLGITTGTVKSHTSRALAAMRVALTTETPDKENEDAHR
jgi:RNA polymerase sigma-70 factor (sigma-E family)